MVLVRLWQLPPSVEDPLARSTIAPSTASAAPQRKSKTRPVRTTEKWSPYHEHQVVPEGSASLGAAEPMAIPASESMPDHREGTGDAIASSGEGTTPGPRFRPAQVLHRKLPPYPFNAFKNNQQGVVDVLVTIDASGKAIASQAYKSSGTPSLDQAAVEAVMHWKFRAAERAGRPITAQAIISLDWIINRSTTVAGETVAAELTAAAQVQGMLECLSNHKSSPELCKSARP